MAIRTTTSCAYGERTSGSAAIASAAAAGTSHPPGSWRPMSGRAPTSARTSLSAAAMPSAPTPSEATLHQPFRAPDEDDRHQHVDADTAPFGEEHLAEG